MDDEVVQARKPLLQLWLNHVIQRCPNDPIVATFLRSEEQAEAAAVAASQDQNVVEEQHRVIEDWPIRVEFGATLTKSQWAVPVAAQWLLRGGGGSVQIDAGGFRQVRWL
jgi:hypothetical protein